MRGDTIVGIMGRGTRSYLLINKLWLKAIESKVKNFYLEGPFQMKCASYLLFYSFVLGFFKGNLLLRRLAVGGRFLCEKSPVSAPIHLPFT